MSSGFVKPVETERFTNPLYEPLCNPEAIKLIKNLSKRCQKLSRVATVQRA